MIILVVGRTLSRGKVFTEKQTLGRSFYVKPAGFEGYFANEGIPLLSLTHAPQALLSKKKGNSMSKVYILIGLPLLIFGFLFLGIYWTTPATPRTEDLVSVKGTGESTDRSLSANPSGWSELREVSNAPNSPDVMSEGKPRLAEGLNASDGTKADSVERSEEIGAGDATDRTALLSQIPQSGDGENFPPFASEREAVEKRIERANGSQSREDLLARVGRAAAATGDFATSATAYTMFFEEFGEDHPYSARIARKLADSLAPINPDTIDIKFTTSGPIYSPSYRMQYVARREHLVAAVAAYELAANLSGDAEQAGSALIRAGWIERALGDWEASTQILDRCVNTYPTSSSANKALALCSENLRWTGHPTEALQRLERLADRLNEPESRAFVLREMKELRYEARRGVEWDSDPTTALAEEIQARRRERTPFEVYRSARLWLQRRNDRDGVLEISRWAFLQADWTKEERVDCGVDVIDALRAIEEMSDLQRDEAISVLADLVDLADKPLAPNFALRQVSLLRKADRLEEAMRVLDSILPVVEDSQEWEPLVLCAKIDCCLEAGKQDTARAAFAVLKERYPRASGVEKYADVFEVSTQKGTR